MKLGANGGKFSKFPENEAKTSKNYFFLLVLMVTPTGLEPFEKGDPAGKAA